VVILCLAPVRRGVFGRYDWLVLNVLPEVFTCRALLR